MAAGALAAGALAAGALAAGALAAGALAAGVPVGEPEVSLRAIVRDVGIPLATLHIFIYKGVRSMWVTGTRW